MPVGTSHWLVSHQKVTTDAKRKLQFAPGIGAASDAKSIQLAARSLEDVPARHEPNAEYGSCVPQLCVTVLSCLCTPLRRRARPLAPHASDRERRRAAESWLSLPAAHKGGAMWPSRSSLYLL